MERKTTETQELALVGNYPFALPPIPTDFEMNSGVRAWYKSMEAWWFELKTVLLRDRESLRASANQNTNTSSALQASLAANVLILQSQITSLSAQITQLQAEVDSIPVTTPSTSALTPTGTGFTHVTVGVQDITSKLVENVDVHVSAGIVESKLALNFPTHSNANDPTAGQKAALPGTSGTPGAGNLYVTNSDPRLSTAELSYALQFMDL